MADLLLRGANGIIISRVREWVVLGPRKFESLEDEFLRFE